MNLPTLYKKTSTGKIQVWEIEPIGSSDGNAVIVTTYGLLNGKKQTATEVISSGKNLGRANATSAHEQAVAEAKSQWEQKVKKGYVESIDDAEQGKVNTDVIVGGVSPMLAHQYDKQGHKIRYPAYVQPKLDGHRCIAVVQDGKCTLWSRTQKRITGVPHIERAIEAMIGHVRNVIFDGELYNHDYRNNFEDLSSFIRQLAPKPGHEVVQYWIYDIVVDLPFEDRNAMLDAFGTLIESKNVGNSLVRVATFEAEEEAAMIELFGVFLNEGYEGAIVRNATGRYANKRSYDLQKVKVMQDSEFKVVDVEEGRGKMAGKAIFVCETEQGGRFSVKMVGALDALSAYFENKDEWIGKMLTVKYQDITGANGVPRFPIGLRFEERL